ncbi:MAG: MAPEG family protein [Spongiibacteraceae bacterium]
MTMFDNYSIALWGMFVVILTLMIQGVVAAASKARLPGAVPGKIDESLSHGSFVFRAHRTYLNSLENISAFLACFFLALFVAASPFWLALLAWVFGLSRIAHMALYYAISTEKNPSPRSYFYLLGLLANFGLIILCGVALLG